MRIHLILLLISVAVFSCSRRETDTLYIATAANVQFAMDELAAVFTEKTGTPCEVIIGSSGKLMAQLREGAPYHVFVSADMKYPETLYRDSLTTAPPTVYAQGSIVFWTLTDSLPDVSILDKQGPGKIALANPNTAPYGKAAMEVLNYYGVADTIKDRLVYGESIAQTNQFIISKTAKAGFTARSVVYSPDWKDKGIWKEVDPGSYAPIEQGVVVIRRNTGLLDEAESFREFLLGAEAAGILEEYGYIVN